MFSNNHVVLYRWTTLYVAFVILLSLIVEVLGDLT